MLNQFPKIVFIICFLFFFKSESIFAERSAHSSPNLKAPGSTVFKSDTNKTQAGSKPPSYAGEMLDQKLVHELYNSGDFEPVITILEEFKKRNRNYSFSDSVFIAKHLAVVYTANPNMHEKGRYYMVQLLELVPTAKIVDMYVSEEIDRIFDKVREEFEARRRVFGLDTLDDTSHAGKDQLSGQKSNSKDTAEVSVGLGWNRPRTWVVCAAGLAAAGTATYFYLSKPENTPPREVFVPNK